MISAMSLGVKNSGAECGPTVTPSCHAFVNAGCSSVRIRVEFPVGRSARARTSPSARTRPSSPPNLPIVKVERLPRYSSASTPPEIAMYTRSPREPTAPTSSTPPAGTVSGTHWGTTTPSSVNWTGAPVTATIADVEKRRHGPSIVTSSPAASTGFPTAILANRKDRSSIGPDGGTPTFQ